MRLVPALLLIGSSLHAGEKFSADWDSLKGHETPQWFADAKFGIYCHWGVYSVPAFGSEWYSRNMYHTNTAEYRHHVATYGTPDEFGYKDFIPLFRAEQFEPGDWAALFARAGAKFAGLAVEHADGFSLWDSNVNPWNAARMGPHRDLVEELSRALRKHHLKFAATFHHQWLWGWYATSLTNSDVYDPAYSSFYGPPLPTNAFSTRNPEPPPTREFVEVWKTKLVQVIDRYHPDLIYLDSRAGIIPEDCRKEFLAHYYNDAARRNREVVMTYKFGDFPRGTAVLDFEKGRLARTLDYLWQCDDPMDWNSWAYLERPDYKSATHLVHELVDTVSKNGVFLLDIGPRADGTIPEPVRERLVAIGDWLRLNGEAIYGTRPWQVFGEGPTEVSRRRRGEPRPPEFTAQDIRFTVKGKTLYAISLGWPAEGLVIQSLSTTSPLVKGRITGVQLLGYKGKLRWSQDEKGLAVQVPDRKPCEHAVVFRIMVHPAS